MNDGTVEKYTKHVLRMYILRSSALSTKQSKQTVYDSSQIRPMYLRGRNTSLSTPNLQ